MKKDEILLKRSRVAYRGNDRPIGDAAVIESDVNLNEESELNSISENFSLSDEHSRRKSRKGTMLSREHTYKDGGNFSGYEVPKESKVGKKLSELTTKRVILLVLIMIIFIPLFVTSFYFDENNSYSLGLHFMLDCLDSNQTLAKAGDNFVRDHRDLDTPLIYLHVDNYYE